MNIFYYTYAIYVYVNIHDGFFVAVIKSGNPNF